MKLGHIKFFVYLGLFLISGPIWYELKGKFSQERIAHIQSNTALLPPNEIQQILKQSFRHIATGSQTFVFISDDAKFILKLLIKAKTRKMCAAMKSYHLAMQRYPEPSGLLYVHAGSCDFTLINKLGIAEKVKREDAFYVLQKRAVSLEKGLAEWIKEGQIREAKTALSSLVQLLVSRSQSGLYDKDHGIMANFGWVDGKAMQLDCGRLQQEEAMRSHETYPQEVRRTLRRLSQWLLVKCPELHEHLEEEIKKL